MLTPEREKELDDMAFEMFAHAYPHEAAEMNWPRFYACVQKVNPAVTETKAREFLAEGGER